MSVSAKSEACVPCQIICVGQATKKMKITKIFRMHNTRSGANEYLWQSTWNWDGQTVIKGLQCDKPLKGKAEEAIGNQIDATLGYALTQWRNDMGLETQTSDPDYRPQCASDACANEGGCKVNISATATMSFDLVASVVKDECVDDPNAPLTTVEVNPAAPPKITSSGC